MRAAERCLILVHRYVGIAVGLLMAMWCLSGIVMMYVPFPFVPESERLRGLAPMAWQDCCGPEHSHNADDGVAISEFQIEMMGTRPVMRARPEGGRAQLVDLATGKDIASLSPDDAVAVATAYARTTGLAAKPSAPETIERDQWTISGLNADRPLYRIALNDPAATQLYVSSTTGKIVQRTTAAARFWNMLGAVPHWLYFTTLRSHAALWTQVIIYTSLAGCLLTVTGLYIGIRHTLRARRMQRWTPYSGFMVWHHVPGLVAGVFTLTWVLSGLFSMNPWGFLDGAGPGAERAHLRGTPPTVAQVKAVLQTLEAAQPAVVSVSSLPLAGSLFLLASPAAGDPVRLDAAGVPAPLSPVDMDFIAAQLAGPEAADKGLMTAEDDYYFGLHGPVSLPVYRVIVGASRTRYYIDPVSGTVLRKVDAEGRAFRWLEEGLHNLDFAAVLRMRPVWDLVMLILLAGVTVICGGGVYLAVRRLTGRPIHSRAASS